MSWGWRSGGSTSCLWEQRNFLFRVFPFSVTPWLCCEGAWSWGMLHVTCGALGVLGSPPFFQTIPWHGLVWDLCSSTGARGFCGLGSRTCAGSAARAGDGSCSSPFHKLMPAGMSLALAGFKCFGGFCALYPGLMEFCSCSHRLPEGFTQLRSLGHLALNDVSLQSLPTDIGK